MRGYFGLGKLSASEKSDILDQHKSVYNGYQTMQPQVSNTQPLTVYDFAGDKEGLVVNNKGEVKKYTNMGINEQVETLKKQNAEYKKALVLFKDKLNEVAVFNANLAYATRLFTEHSTTKQEKLNILKRFDTVSTMNEAKSLFSTIKTELGSKTTVTESVAKKISNTPSTSSSTEVLSESKAYENPQFSRIKEMMRKIK
jgi:hypothetical protein